MDADLRGQVLVSADLSGADLAGADLSDAKLHFAKLVGTTLTGASLRRANLANADLSGADLRGADLRGASLRDTRLDGAVLDRARHDERTVWPVGFDPPVEGAGEGAPATTATPPGWYPDPWSEVDLRWWDGSAWTAHGHGDGPM